MSLHGVPSKIGRYEVLGQLATGGMAEILLARLSGPAAFERAVVIKRILRQYAQNESFVTMFLDEARTVARIRHPNVVQVQELGEDGGEVFLVLEYVAGENLSSILKRTVAASETLDPVLLAHIAAEACAGLHAAHELVGEAGRPQNLVHRDVSPQNLFVAYDGHVKLLDFGVAITEERGARTEVGDVKGKLEYMSPEQARAQPLDRRSDIFAMGIVLYELGTGRRLFKRRMPMRTLDAICTEPVLPPSRLTPGFPPALEAIIMKALAKDPGERFATAAEMRLALLEVSRSSAHPVEALAEHMRRWFPERIAEKEEMLRRLADGDALSHVPAGEVDEQVRVLEVPASPGSPSIAPVPLAPAPAGLPFPVIAGLVVAGLLSIGAASLALRRRAVAPDASVAPSAVAVAVSAAPPPPPPLAPPLPPVATARANVLVRIESQPAGAHVLVGGDDQGVTPLDLRLARGDAPVFVEVRKTGYAATRQNVVPDADQKLLVALSKAGRRPRPTASPSSSGFRRFD